MIESPAPSQLAKRIASLRSDRGWPARELADRCARAGSTSLTRSTLAKIESGVRKSVTADEIAVLARVFELSVDALLGVRTTRVEDASVASTARTPPAPSLDTPTEKPPVDVRRIGIVEDHESVVMGLQLMLSDQPDLEVAVTAQTVPELLAAAKPLDLVILDLRLGDGSSPTENIELLRSAGLNTLVFTGAENPYMVRLAARAGVLGVMRKSEARAVVVAAIRAASHGAQVATTDWAAAIDSDPELMAVGLSPRQREVLDLYASGSSVRRVAYLMGVSDQTVIDYLGRIRQKYAAAGRAAPTKTDLYKRAIEDGLLPVPESPRQ